MNMVGNTKVERWFDGVAPDSVEGATLLGYSKHGRLELALYELKSGDFCSVYNGVGTVVSRRDFPKYIADEGCPWEITDAKFNRMKKLILKIKAENKASGYDPLKAAKRRLAGNRVGRKTEKGKRGGEAVCSGDSEWPKATKEQLDNRIKAELYDLFVEEATKTDPPDIDAADKAVIKCISEKVEAMMHGERCYRVAYAIYGDFREYMTEIHGKGQKDKKA